MVDQSSKHETTVPVGFGGEAFLETLNNNNVELVFINSGTDTFPIQEAAAKYQAEGKRTPKFILCPDETTAVAAAHEPRRPAVGHSVVLGARGAGDRRDALLLGPGGNG